MPRAIVTPPCSPLVQVAVSGLAIVRSPLLSPVLSGASMPVALKQGIAIAKGNKSAGLNRGPQRSSSRWRDLMQAVDRLKV